MMPKACSTLARILDLRRLVNRSASVKAWLRVARRFVRSLMRLLLGLFAWLHKNELDATSHFCIPSNRVIELGTRLDLLPLETAGYSYLP